MSYIFQLFLSSAALSTFSYVPKPFHSQNILHPYFVNNQLTFPPSQCPLVSANVINHSSLSAYVLHISTLSILCSSFTFPYLPKPFPSQISFIHIFVEQPTNISPSACPLASVNEINHSSLSAHVLHISFPLYYIFRSERERERKAKSGKGASSAALSAR